MHQWMPCWDKMKSSVILNEVTTTGWKMLQKGHGYSTAMKVHKNADPIVDR